MKKRKKKKEKKEKKDKNKTRIIQDNKHISTQLNIILII
jgi:hypothetical protein